MRLLLLLALLTGIRAFAQQTSQYTQYVFNMFALNPAVAGSKDCIDVRLGYRQQWVGFPGAPVTGWATICGTIRPKHGFRANRHGIGAFVESDNTGAIGYTSFQLAYAYHIQMKRDFFMSLGFFAGVKQEKLSLGDVVAENNDDPALMNNASSLVYPDISPGIWLYSKTTWAGLSVRQALGNKVDGFGTETKLAREFLFSIGHRYRMSRDFSVVPSGLLRLGKGAPLALNLGVMMEYKKKIGLGIGYRNQDAVTFKLKVPFLKYFALGYSYDVTTSRLRYGGANTHEIILAIYPCTPMDPAKAIVRCPIFE